MMGQKIGNSRMIMDRVSMRLPSMTKIKTMVSKT